MDKACHVCGSLFRVIAHRKDTAKYCAPKCYRRAMVGRGSVEVECAHCHKPFSASPSRRRRFCSRACVGKASKETWKATFATVRKNMAARGMLTRCERCGYDEHPEILGVHHIDEDRDNNEPSNLIVLCPTCHSLAHMKHIAHGGHHDRH